MSMATPATAPTSAHVIEQALPYIESGLPVIATLFPPGGGHAVVCIGRQLGARPVVDTSRVMAPLGISHRVASDWVETLIIHNDNTGPLVVPCGIEAQNHWSSSSPVGMWAGCI